MRWAQRLYLRFRNWLYDHVIMKPIGAFIVSFGALAIGAVLSIFPTQIRDATLLLMRGPRGGIDWWVLIFWALTAVWFALLYYRLKGDDRTQTTRFEQLTSAIHRAPNVGIFAEYSSYYDLAAQAVASTHVTKTEIEDRIQILELGIRVALNTCATLAEVFAKASGSAAYGANVMLAAQPPYPDQLKDALRFFDRENNDPNTLRAILYLPRTLLIADVEEKDRRGVPLISLPVPHRARDRRGHQLALPGAPHAFLAGTQSAYVDTRKLATQFHGVFQASVVDELRHYFSPEGDGRDVRSFVSFRIGDEKRPLGVLNIDSNETFVLGNPEYHLTFFALMSPILRLLRKPVADYHALTSAQNRFIR